MNFYLVYSLNFLIPISYIISHFNVNIYFDILECLLRYNISKSRFINKITIFILHLKAIKNNR